MSRTRCLSIAFLLLIALSLLPCHTFAGSSSFQYLSTGIAGGQEQEREERKHEALYNWINFLILVGALGYLLRRPLSEFFTERSESIRKGLEEGRRALKTSRDRLRAIEDRLGRLEQEIANFKAAAQREMEAERERLRKLAAEETEKIFASAHARMETATRAARLELRVFVAQQSVALAEQMIKERLDDSRRKQLVEEFVENLKVSQA